MKQVTVVLNVRVPDDMKDTELLDDLGADLSLSYGWVMLQRDNRTVVRSGEAEREMRYRESWGR